MFHVKKSNRKSSQISIPKSIKTIELINFSKLQKKGRGGFAKVYKIVDKKTNKIFVAKIFKADLYDLDIRKQTLFTREIEVLSRVNCSSIIKFYGYSSTNFKNQTRPVIVTEFLTNGSLSEALELERQGLSISDWNNTKKFIIIYGIYIQLIFGIEI